MLRLRASRGVRGLVGIRRLVDIRRSKEVRGLVELKGYVVAPSTSPYSLSSAFFAYLSTYLLPYYPL
jgi:hypothetical protein